MTNSQFHRLLLRVIASRKKHKLLLAKAEEEYVSRYGQNPSEAGDDSWLDTFRVGISHDFDYEKMAVMAEYCNRNFKPEIQDTFNQ